VRVRDAVGEGKGVSVFVGMGRAAVAVGGHSVFCDVPYPWGVAVGEAGIPVAHASREALKRMHIAAARTRNSVRLILRLYGLCRSVSIRFDNIGLPHL